MSAHNFVYRLTKTAALSLLLCVLSCAGGRGDCPMAVWQIRDDVRCVSLWSVVCDRPEDFSTESIQQ